MSDDVRFSEVAFGPAFFAFLPAASLCVLAVWMVAARSRTRLSTYLWCVPALLLLAASCAWYVMGVGASNPLALLAFCASAILAARETLGRDGQASPAPARLGGLLASVDARAAHLTLRQTLALVCVAGVLVLELTGNGRPYLLLPWFAALELLIVGGLVIVLWLVCGRRGAGPALGLAVLEAIGLVQHYVLLFRGTAILPSDVFALGTALSVSGGYTFGLSNSMLLGFCALVLGLALCARLSDLRLQDGNAHAHGRLSDLRVEGGVGHTRGHVRALSHLRDLATAVAVLALTVAVALVPDYGALLGADMDYWWSKDWYERQGFLPSFAYALQDLRVSEPAGYSAEAAQRAQDELVAAYHAQPGIEERRSAATAQFGAIRPNVVVIQNETFCDLSNFDGLGAGYAGPEFWNKGVGDVLMRGDFAVSVFGGGTCNTEFEFLTGDSLAFLGTAKYPFAMYDLSEVDSLPRQLGAQGYRTIGIHPNVASNWNRDRAYEQLGFDEFLSMDDFEGAEQFHTHVSDWATYERVLELLDASDEPVFAFDVTMQNHSGYDTGSIPTELLPSYEVAGLSADDTFQLNEYLACIDESDRAFERLLKELTARDEPTVVVMYGDHHAWFAQALNDVLFPGEDELVHAERIHNTSYVTWANYDVAGWDETSGEDARDDASADLLAAMALDAIGAPLTNFQQALLGARVDVAALNANGYRTPDGTWHPLDADGALRNLSYVEYHAFDSLL